MNLTERYNKKLKERVEQAEVKLDGILLQLEVTNACNHRCIFCPNMDSKRKKRMMDEGLARRVMEECAEFLGEDKRICFHMNGEPFLYNKLPELVKYSKELGFDYSFVTTNGSLANEETLARIIDAGLDSIKFSINAGKRETYKLIHGADDFDKAMDALKFSWKYREENKREYKIFVSCVGIKDNFKELEEFNRVVSQYCDEVVFYYPCAYAGQKIEMAKELRCDMSGLGIHSFEIKHTVPCAVLWNSINITCEGYLSLCCSEADNRMVIEDINNKKVKDAWLGEKMVAIRQKHLSGEIADMPCTSCIEETVYDKEKIDKELFALSLGLQ